MTTEFQENAIGVRIEIEFVDELGDPLDLTTAQAIAIRFSLPGGQTKEVTGLVAVNPPGTDGLAEFFTTNGLLVPQGDWDIQGFVTFSGGDDLPTFPQAFVVNRNIRKP